MKKSNVIATTLGSLALGAIVGILFAPDKGSKTRKKISGKAKDITEDLKNSIEDLTSTISEKYDVVKEKSTELVKDGAEKIDALKKDIINTKN